MKQQNSTLKKAMIEALEKSLGIVTTAAKMVGIDRTTHYLWMREDETYKEAVEGINDMAIDFAESQLNVLMQGASHEVVTNRGDIVEIKDAPNPSSIIFYLKTKGKKRGYVEKQEVELSGEREIFKGLDLNIKENKESQ
jgi:hypothetical protein